MSSELSGSFLSIIVKDPLCDFGLAVQYTLSGPQVVCQTAQHRRYLPFPLRYILVLWANPSGAFK